MRIKRGRTRIAIVSERMTLKIPNIPLGKAVRKLSSELRGIAQDCWQMKQWPTKAFLKVEVVSREPFIHFFGFTANRLEARNSVALGEMVVPTRYSFLGILNVMETATQSGINPSAFAKEFRLGGHTFSHVENYGIHEGSLKLLDYGDSKAISILQLQCQSFRWELDIVYARHQRTTERIINSRGQTFNDISFVKEEIERNRNNPQKWPVESEVEANLAREFAAMTLKGLQEIFVSLISCEHPVIESSSCFLSEKQPLIAFLDNLSGSSTEVQHHFRKPLAKLKTLQSELADERREGDITPDREAALERMILGAIKYKAFMRELMIRWNREGFPIAT